MADRRTRGDYRERSALTYQSATRHDDSGTPTIVRRRRDREFVGRVRFEIREDVARVGSGRRPRTLAASVRHVRTVRFDRVADVDWSSSSSSRYDGNSH